MEHLTLSKAESSTNETATTDDGFEPSPVSSLSSPYSPPLLPRGSSSHHLPTLRQALHRSFSTNTLDSLSSSIKNNNTSPLSPKTSTNNRNRSVQSPTFVIPLSLSIIFGTFVLVNIAAILSAIDNEPYLVTLSTLTSFSPLSRLPVRETFTVSVNPFAYLTHRNRKLQLLKEDTLTKAYNKYPGERIIMADEFNGVVPDTNNPTDDNGMGFDLSFWKHDITMCGFGNGEFQGYTNNRSVTFVKEGILYLRPILLSDAIGIEKVEGNPDPFEYDIFGLDPASRCTVPQEFGCMRGSDAQSNPPKIINPIQSGRIKSEESFSFRYGRIEINMKLPKGDWISPSVKLLPRYNVYGGWPNSGEIDIMESRGNDPSYPSGGHDSFFSSLQWGPSYDRNRYDLTSQWYKYPGNTKSLADDFHIYGLVWEPHQLYTYIDTDDIAHRILTVNFPPESSSMWEYGRFDSRQDNIWVTGASNAPFDQEFYLVINVAIGGTFFPPSPDRPWTNDLSNNAAMREFWRKRNQWLPSWWGNTNLQPPKEDTYEHALAIDYVRVWQKDSLSGSNTYSSSKSNNRNRYPRQLNRIDPDPGVLNSKDHQFNNPSSYRDRTG